MDGLYRTAASRVQIRDPEKNTPRPKLLRYCLYVHNFERGANTLRTARGYTTISDRGLYVKKTVLAHIFSYLVAYQSSLHQNRKSVTSRTGRENSKSDLSVTGSLQLYEIGVY